jgi:hypothetical protein
MTHALSAYAASLSNSSLQNSIVRKMRGISYSSKESEKHITNQKILFLFIDTISSTSMAENTLLSLFIPRESS